jgi:hypothetical protein
VTRIWSQQWGLGLMFYVHKNRTYLGTAYYIILCIKIVLGHRKVFHLHTNESSFNHSINVMTHSADSLNFDAMQIFLEQLEIYLFIHL